MEELSATAAEEIETRDKELAALREDLRAKVTANKEVSRDYEVGRCGEESISSCNTTAMSSHACTCSIYKYFFSTIIQKLSLAYETVVHQYAELVEERQQLFNAFADARNEIAQIKAQIRE